MGRVFEEIMSNMTSKSTQKSFSVIFEGGWKNVRTYKWEDWNIGLSTNAQKIMG